MMICHLVQRGIYITSLQNIKKTNLKLNKSNHLLPGWMNDLIISLYWKIRVQFQDLLIYYIWKPIVIINRKRKKYIKMLLFRSLIGNLADKMFLVVLWQRFTSYLNNALFLEEFLCRKRNINKFVNFFL